MIVSEHNLSKRRVATKPVTAVGFQLPRDDGSRDQTVELRNRECKKMFDRVGYDDSPLERLS
jgi:hypothetical protein